MKYPKNKLHLILLRNILIHNLNDMGINGEDIGTIFKINRSSVFFVLKKDKKELLKEYNNSMMFKVDYNK